MVKGDKPKPAAKPRAKKANGFKFPEKLPNGEVLKDSMKKEWILGNSIGKGGFGEIYCASKYEDGKFDKSYPLVVKIEPHENGPLFMEKNFYIKVAKPEEVEAWKSKEKLKFLGIPTYLASGVHMFKTVKYRFLVIDRFGKDLWSIFLEKKIFPPETVYKCALQIIDALEYIHSKEYIHGDIKGANLLLGLKKGTENNVFLVDFGLACKYSTKEFKKDPKQEHNGTIEYTSCDWHLGIPTRRGDMEILGFNLLHWLSSSLPWEKDIKNKEKVHEKKQELMKNVGGYLKTHFPNVSQVVVKYMEYVSKLKYDQAPDYDKCRGLFISELKNLSCPLGGKLNFDVSKSPLKSPKKGATPKKVAASKNLKRKTDDESDDEVAPKKKTRSSPRKQVFDDEQDENSEPEVPIKAKRLPRKKPAKKAPIKTRKISTDEDSEPEENGNEISDDDEIIANTPEEPKKAVKKPRVVKKTEVNKISWRDAPTVAGNLNNKAGVYVKKTGTTKARK